MSTNIAVELQDYIERIAQIIENDSTIFPPNEKNLVTAVLRNKPPVEQSSTSGVIPYIIVFESAQPIRELEKAGRDTRDVEGGTVYELEIYVIAIVQELDSETSQRKLHFISQAIRDALGRNMRLIDPIALDDPLCRTHTRFQIPYLLSLNNPTLKGMNTVIRPQVYVSLRSP